MSSNTIQSSSLSSSSSSSSQLSLLHSTIAKQIKSELRSTHTHISLVHKLKYLMETLSSLQTNKLRKSRYSGLYRDIQLCRKKQVIQNTAKEYGYGYGKGVKQYQGRANQDSVFKQEVNVDEELCIGAVLQKNCEGEVKNIGECFLQDSSNKGHENNNKSKCLELITNYYQCMDRVGRKIYYSSVIDY